MMSVLSKYVTKLNEHLQQISKLIGLLILLTAPVKAVAEALDAAVADDAFLNTIVEALNAYGIDVVHNLNAREVARGRVTKPRLGRFPDLPLNTLATSSELEAWETEFLGREIGGLVLMPGQRIQSPGVSEFLEDWLLAPAEERQFITYHNSDSEAVEKIASVAAAYGYSTLLLADLDVLIAGNFYATAAQRLAIDSREARRFRSAVTEIEYLGERVRRNSNSLFRENNDDRLARNEPSIFLKESLGDEFNQSTIREIIVPGGVALGETATLPLNVNEMIFGSGGLALIDEQGQQWLLPQIEDKQIKSLFDFVNRSELLESDAIVDIDEERRVRISQALRDTDAGFQILHADTMPFEYVSNLAVTKSVIIDTSVDWEILAAANLGFETDYEVRFLSADNMRIAQTRAALEYVYKSASNTSEYRDSWGQDVRRLRENLDYSGLGNSMEKVANYAGWIGLFRKLREDDVPFLRGRYEFMKIDKTGQITPSRY